MDEFDKALAGLVEHAEKLGEDGSELDEYVHEYKSSEAAEINNGGVETQLEYMLRVLADSPKELPDAIEQIRDCLGEISEA